MSEEEKTKEQEDFEAKQNELDFFNLLLKIDQRTNPKRYKPKETRKA